MVYDNAKKKLPSHFLLIILIPILMQFFPHCFSFFFRHLRLAPAPVGVATASTSVGVAVSFVGVAVSFMSVTVSWNGLM